MGFLTLVGLLLMVLALSLNWFWAAVAIFIPWSVGAYIYGTRTIYRWAKEGYLFVSVPTNSMLAILVGRNPNRAYVTPPDRRTETYFKWLQENSPHGSLYRIISPGHSGLRWKGLPDKTDVPRLADTQELRDITDEVLHALRMQERELTYDFEPEAKELEAIRKEIETASQANLETLKAFEARGNRGPKPKLVTVSADKVRKLSFVPDQKTSDQIEVGVRLRLFLASVDPIISLTKIDFPGDMIRGKIIPRLREVMTELDFYHSIVEPRKSERTEQGDQTEPASASGSPDQPMSKAEAEHLLIRAVQVKLRRILGFKEQYVQTGAPEFFVSRLKGIPMYRLKKGYKTLPHDHNAQSEQDLIISPNDAGYEDQSLNPFTKGSVLDQVLRDWGYYIRDVLVEDVSEKEGTITKALAQVAEAAAKASANKREAEGNRAAQIIRAEGAKREKILLGEGDRDANRARITAFSLDGKTVDEGALGAFALWFKTQALQLNADHAGRTFLVWPDLPSEMKPFAGAFNALKDRLIKDPALLMDDAALARSVREQLGLKSEATTAPIGGEAK